MLLRIPHTKFPTRPSPCPEAAATLSTPRAGGRAWAHVMLLPTFLALMSVPDPLMSVAPPPPFMIEPMLPPRPMPPKLAPTSHEWAVQAGGGSSEAAGRAIATDGAGGALVTGHFTTAGLFGSKSLLSRGGEDAFVMHVTASGDIDWAVQAGGTGINDEARGSGIAHDGAGGAFVTGVFSGTASFGDTSLTSRGSFDAFVLHVTASGLIDWAVQAGGASYDYDQGYGIAHDGANGGAFVTGCFAGEAHFGSYAVTSRGVPYAVFVMHVTASGVIDWVVQAGGMGFDNFGRGIAHDGSGGALVTGTFDGNGDEAWFGSIPLTSRSSYDTFVMHVTASGAIDWAVTAGTSALDWECIFCEVYVLGVGIAHDGAGGALVTGAFKGEAFFGSKSLKSRGGIYDDVFVMHVTASGAIDWAVQAGGASYDQGNGIAHDGAGGAFVTGDFMGEASFGSMSLVSLGGSDAFVMHVTSSGAIDWAVQLGGAAVAPPFDVAYGIAYDDTLEAGALVTGAFRGEASFGSNSLANRGAAASCFVASLVPPPKEPPLATTCNGGFVSSRVESLALGRVVCNAEPGSRSWTPGGSQEACEARGCCWVPVQMGDPRGTPGCFYLVAPSPPPTRPQEEVPSDVVSSNWAVEVEGTASSSGNGIAHDGAGGAFVTGVFSGTASFGDTSLTSRGSFDAFVLHVTASGLIDWAVQAGGASYDYDQGYGIAHDGANGGAFVTGCFAGEAHFGSYAVTSRGVPYAVFVMHVTASGVIDWVVQAGGMGFDNFGRGIAHDGSGGALVTGTFDGNGDEAWFGSIPLTSRSSYDTFVMHVTASGVIDWVVQAGAEAPGPAYSRTYVGGQGLAHDGAGGALVTGVFKGEAFFGSTYEWNGTHSKPVAGSRLKSHSQYDSDMFVMHVTALGAVDWVVQAGGWGSTHGSNIAHDGVGGAFVTGDFMGTASFGSTSIVNLGGSNTFVMHVTASGIIDWAVRAGSSDAGDQAFGYEGSGRGIAYDGTGGAFVTGHFRGEALFGSTSFVSRDSDDASSYAMHVTASGVIDWALQLGGAADDIGLSIASDGAGGVLVTGHFTGEGTFGSKTLSNRGGLTACFVVSLVPTLRPPVPARRLPPPALAVQEVSSGVSILLVGAALAFTAAVLFALMFW